MSMLNMWKFDSKQAFRIKELQTTNHKPQTQSYIQDEKLNLSVQ